MFSNNILASNKIVLGNEILDPEDAFKMTITKIEDSLFLNWNIEKTYYLYQNSIEVIHKDQSILYAFSWKLKDYCRTYKDDNLTFIGV